MSLAAIMTARGPGQARQVTPARLGDSGSPGARRLLASQLQEEKQQHEEEVEGLHLDIRSLKQLSQQQAALIQDLQRHQGQEGLQHHVVRLKEENWVRVRGQGSDSSPHPIVSCSIPLGSDAGDPKHPPAPYPMSWVLVGVAEPYKSCPCTGAGPEAGEAGEDHHEAPEAAQSLREADPGLHG